MVADQTGNGRSDESAPGEQDVDDASVRSPLAELLRVERIRRGQTLAEAAAEIGVHKTSWLSWEVDERPPPAKHIAAVADYVGLTTAEIVELRASADPTTTDRAPFNEAGTMIKAERERRQQAQTDAAAEFGVAQRTWSQWEAGTLRPARKHFTSLAKYLGITVDQLYGKLYTGGSLFSQALARERLRRGLGQRQVAEQLGVTQSQYSRWETGRLNPPREHYPALCSYLSVTDNELHSLVYGEEPAGPAALRAEVDGLRRQVADQDGELRSLRREVRDLADLRRRLDELEGQRDRH